MPGTATRLRSTAQYIVQLTQGLHGPAAYSRNAKARKSLMQYVFVATAKSSAYRSFLACEQQTKLYDSTEH
eukprot:6193576-Pleurochrysis_carterae.AAC.1